MTTFLIALVDDPRLAMATIGSLLVVAGSVTPWARIASALGALTENGLDADGKITILLGVVVLALVIAYSRLRQTDLLVAAGLLSLVAAGFAITYQINLRRATSRVIARMLAVDPSGVTAKFGAKTGVGVSITLAGA